MAVAGGVTVAYVCRLDSGGGLSVHGTSALRSSCCVAVCIFFAAPRACNFCLHAVCAASSFTAACLCNMVRSSDGCKSQFASVLLPISEEVRFRY